MSRGLSAATHSNKKMKKIILIIFLLVAMTTIHAVNANAQTEKRIEFAGGRSSATVTGDTGSTGVTYVLKARSGQKLIFDLKPAAKVGIKVETEGKYGHEVLLREERGGHYEIGLEESGDYTVFIGSLDHKPVRFSLTVKITKLADI